RRSRGCDLALQPTNRGDFPGARCPCDECAPAHRTEAAYITEKIADLPSTSRHGTQRNAIAPQGVLRCAGARARSCTRNPSPVAGPPDLHERRPTSTPPKQAPANNARAQPHQGAAPQATRDLLQQTPRAAPPQDEGSPPSAGRVRATRAAPLG